MQTSSHSGSTAIPRRPSRSPAYYLGRKADVWLALRPSGGHPAGGDGRRTPTFARLDAGAGRS
jgi:hypothetical protein